MAWSIFGKTQSQTSPQQEEIRIPPAPQTVTPHPAPEPAEPSVTEPKEPKPYIAPGLGDRVRDPITKFEGIVVVVATWLHGCIRCGVQPEGMHDGKPLQDQHFDQSQLEVIEQGVYKPMVLGVAEPPPVEPRRSPGGPARESAGYKREER